MPTISSMIQKNDMVANLSYRYFKLDSEAAHDSVLVSAPIQTNANFLKSDFGGQPALTTLVENYSADKDEFQSKIQDKLDSLQESSEKLKDTVKEDEENNSETSETEKSPTSNLSKLGEFAKDNVPPRAKILVFQPRQEKNSADRTEEITNQIENLRERKLEERRQHDRIIEFAENYLVNDEEKSQDEDTSETPKTSEENTVERVQNMVRSYNSVVSYLNENREISNKISTLVSSFNTTQSLQTALSSIGISANSSGELTVDPQRLLNALEDNADKVISILGSTGLTGQMNKSVSLANYQGENLFPTIEEYSREEKVELWEQLYSARTSNTANYAQHKAGNILNMFT